MSELSVLIVWGPLMIGGGYYVITGQWEWNVALASLPYALGVTAVIFGKHIDKYDVDKAKGIHTLPVVIGEKPSRIISIGMMIVQYVLAVYLVVTGFFTPVTLIVLLALPTFIKRILPLFLEPKPAEKPVDFPDVWPNYFVAAGFYHNRQLGALFLLGLLINAILVVAFGW